MPAPVEPAVIVETAEGGRLEHPCPPDPDRIRTVVAGLFDGFEWDRVEGLRWSYRPPPPDTPPVTRPLTDADDYGSIEQQSAITQETPS